MLNDQLINEEIRWFGRFQKPVFYSLALHGLGGNQVGRLGALLVNADLIGNTWLDNVNYLWGHCWMCLVFFNTITICVQVSCFIFVIVMKPSPRHLIRFQTYCFIFRIKAQKMYLKRGGWCKFLRQKIKIIITIHQSSESEIIQCEFWRAYYSQEKHFQPNF